jgi:hypothetical protein
MIAGAAVITTRLGVGDGGGWGGGWVLPRRCQICRAMWRLRQRIASSLVLPSDYLRWI